jgi:hypothetical protein
MVSEKENDGKIMINQQLPILATVRERRTPLSLLYL